MRSARRPLHTLSRLGALRTRAGLSQAEAAARLGVHQTGLSSWEAGRSRAASHRVPELAALYQVTPKEIQQAIEADRRHYARLIQKGAA